MAGRHERGEGSSRVRARRSLEETIDSDDPIFCTVLVGGRRVRLLLPRNTRVQDICGRVEETARRHNCIQEHERVAHIELTTRDLTKRSGLEVDATLDDVLVLCDIVHCDGARWVYNPLVAVVGSRNPSTRHAQQPQQPIGGATNANGTAEAPSTPLRGARNPPTPIAVHPKPLQDRAETASPPERASRSPEPERASLPKRKLQVFSESPSPPSTEVGGFRIRPNTHGRVATKPLQDRAETASPPERASRSPEPERASLPKRKLQVFSESPSPPSTEVGGFRIRPNTHGRVATKPLQDRAETASPPERASRSPEPERASLPKRKLQVFSESPSPPSTEVGGFRIRPNTHGRVATKPLQDRAETASPLERASKSPEPERASLPKRKLRSFVESPSSSDEFRVRPNTHGRVGTKRSLDQVSDSPRRRYETRHSRRASSGEISNNPLLSAVMASPTTRQKVGMHRPDMAHLDRSSPFMAPRVSDSLRGRLPRRMSSAEISDTALLPEVVASPTTKKVGVRRPGKEPVDPFPPVVASTATTTKVAVHQPDPIPPAMATVKEEEGADANARTYASTRNHDLPVYSDSWGHSSFGEIPRKNPSNSESLAYPGGVIPNSDPEDCEESLAYPGGVIPNSPVNSESMLSPVGRTNSSANFKRLRKANPCPSVMAPQVSDSQTTSKKVGVHRPGKEPVDPCPPVMAPTATTTTKVAVHQPDPIPPAMETVKEEEDADANARTYASTQNHDLPVYSDSWGHSSFGEIPRKSPVKSAYPVGGVPNSPENSDSLTYPILRIPNSPSNSESLAYPGGILPNNDLEDSEESLGYPGGVIPNSPEKSESMLGPGGRTTNNPVNSESTPNTQVGESAKAGEADHQRVQQKSTRRARKTAAAFLKLARKSQL